MYRSFFSRDLFSELDRLQNELSGVLDYSPSIRGLSRGSFPALNIGSTSTGVEVYAFAPGVDPATIDVQLERGVLTIAGERKNTLPGGADEKTTLHINERFTGRFRRVVSMPEDIDPASVNAEFRDGVLRVALKRREAAQPRRIEVQ